MKRLLFIILILSSTSLFAAPKINKENCTITLDNGKTFPLYGAIKIVDRHEDLCVKIVDRHEDLYVEIVENFADDCGEWEMVENFEDMRIKIVDRHEDIQISFVKSFPGIR